MQKHGQWVNAKTVDFWWQDEFLQICKEILMRKVYNKVIMKVKRNILHLLWDEEIKMVWTCKGWSHDIYLEIWWTKNQEKEEEASQEKNVYLSRKSAGHGLCKNGPELDGMERNPDKYLGHYWAETPSK